MIDRAERNGLGIAAAGHVILFGLLSVGFLATPNPLKLQRTPVEVSLVTEAALRSTAPEPTAEAPRAAEAPEQGNADPPPSPVKAEPVPPKSTLPSTARPAAAASPAAKPKPPAETVRRPRLGREILAGIDADTAGQRASTPAAVAGPAVQSAIAAEIRRQLKPHWKAPSGADAELLRTELSISLARDGSVTEIRFLRQTGVNDSNRAQASLHREAAIRAVRLAAPFKLPVEYYDAWRLLEPLGFDKRLSQ